MDNIIKRIRDSDCLDSVKKDADKTVNYILAKTPEACTLFSEQAVNALRDNYVGRMTYLLYQAVFTEIQNVMLNENIGNFEVAAQKTAELIDYGSSDYFSRKYPFFSEHHERIDKNFISSTERFIHNLLTSRELISQKLLNGQNVTRIEKLIMDDLSIRRHGQEVIGISTNVGNVFYKPHDCTIDMLYSELINKYFHDCTSSTDVLVQKEYGFVSEIVRNELSSQDEAAKYFKNFGILTALLFAIGSRDIHKSNIIPCGVFPVIIDVEALLCGESSAKDFDEKTFMANKDFYYSLVKTSIMPERSYKGELSSPLYENVGSNLHLPYYKDKFFTVEGFEENYINGFSEGYKRVIEHSAEIIAMFEANKNVTLRHIMYTSRYYHMVMFNMLKPESMLTQEAHDKAIRKLYSAIDINEEKSVANKLFDYESSCITAIDLPYYCVKVDGRALCGANTSEILVNNYFTKSPFDMLKARLARLSEAEYRFEEDYIRSLFRQVPQNINIEAKYKISGEIASTENVYNSVKKIWQDLNNYMIHGTDNLPLWFSPVQRIEALPNGEPYSAWASVALFCSAMRNSSDELMNLSLKAIDIQVQSWREQDAWKMCNKVSSGLYSGLGGIAIALSASKNEHYIDNFLKMVREKSLFLGKNIQSDFGTSGLLLGLLSIKRSGSESKFLDELIVKCANHIMTQLTTIPNKPEAAAGIASGLAGAYYFTNQKSFAERAMTILDSILENYSEDLSGWSESKILWIENKSPCSASIAYHSLNVAEYLSSDNALHLAILALDSICNDQYLLQRDSIYRGNAASIIVLIKAYKQLSKIKYFDKAERIISSMIERYSHKLAFNVMPEGINNFFDPSFFYGTLGIGYALIQYIQVKGGKFHD